MPARRRSPSRARCARREVRLPNGNTLITESDGGRLFEVTKPGKIVWNYINPVRAQREQDGQQVIPIVSWAERIDPSTLDPKVLAEPAQISGVPAGPPPNG